jgi:thioredoxin 1
VDDNPRSAANYGIKGIPTMILFNKGKEVERIVGVTSKESIGRLIEKYGRLEAPKHKAA